MYLHFLTTSFLYLVVTLDLKQSPRSGNDLEIWPQSAFTAFRALCPLQTILPSDLVGCDSQLQ
jgi:hypothetical protein